MSDEPVQKHPDGGKHDTTDYSASKAPETQAAADGSQSPSDVRLKPGGATGAAADVGMTGIDPGEVPSGGVAPDQVDTGGSPDDGTA